MSKSNLMNSSKLIWLGAIVHKMSAQVANPLQEHSINDKWPPRYQKSSLVIITWLKEKPPLSATMCVFLSNRTTCDVQTCIFSSTISAPAATFVDSSAGSATSSSSTCSVLTTILASPASFFALPLLRGVFAFFGEGIVDKPGISSSSSIAASAATRFLVGEADADFLPPPLFLVGVFGGAVVGCVPVSWLDRPASSSQCQDGSDTHQ